MLRISKDLKNKTNRPIRDFDAPYKVVLLKPKQRACNLDAILYVYTYIDLCMYCLYVEKPVCKSPGYCSYRTFPFKARKYGSERVEYTVHACIVQANRCGCYTSLAVFI